MKTDINSNDLSNHKPLTKVWINTSRLDFINSLNLINRINLNKNPNCIDKLILIDNPQYELIWIDNVYSITDFNKISNNYNCKQFESLLEYCNKHQLKVIIGIDLLKISENYVWFKKNQYYSSTKSDMIKSNLNNPYLQLELIKMINHCIDFGFNGFFIDNITSLESSYCNELICKNIIEAMVLFNGLIKTIRYKHTDTIFFCEIPYLLKSELKSYLNVFDLVINKNYSYFNTFNYKSLHRTILKNESINTIQSRYTRPIYSIKEFELNNNREILICTLMTQNGIKIINNIQFFTSDLIIWFEKLVLITNSFVSKPSKGHSRPIFF